MSRGVVVLIYVRDTAPSVPLCSFNVSLIKDERSCVLVKWK